MSLPCKKAQQLAVRWLQLSFVGPGGLIPKLLCWFHGDALVAGRSTSCTLQDKKHTVL